MRDLKSDEDRIPIAVDLDGTLVMTDTLHEGVIGSLKARPKRVLRARSTLQEGKAAFKRRVAGHVELDAELLPYNPDLLAYLHAAKQSGRRLGLFTAADQSIAESVAAHLGIFDVVRGSDGVVNLSGTAKVAAIREELGPRFVYAGDAVVDDPIFAAAEKVILVGPVDRLRKRLDPAKHVEATFPGTSSGRLWMKALRLPHWVKNLLVFVAPVLGIQSLTSGIAFEALLLFVLMGLVASATYIVNDLLDLAADRQHPKKRFRPFASGALPIRSGVIVGGLMLALSFVVALALPLGAFLCLGVYLALTLCYSLSLKRAAIIDVVTLAGLFTVRVAAGGFLLPTPTSPWLLTFSMLFFLNLAMVKRYAELDRVVTTLGEDARARGYTKKDLPILLTTGIASGLSSIVIFTIYLINEQYPLQFYRQPQALWGIMPILLIWTLRVWHLSVHGLMNEDPVLFALKDRLSLVLAGAVGLVLIVAWI